MTIDSNFYEAMSTGEIPTHVDFVLNLEVLNGCAHHCDGCYVARKNPMADADFDTALALAQDADEQGLRFRELVLGPTDLFSATNTLDVLRSEKFQKLMSINPITRITATAMFEGLDEQRFKDVFDALDNSRGFKEDMILEFLVPINAKKILEGDAEYLAAAHRFVDFMKYGTPKRVDWSFIVNIKADHYVRQNFDELTRIVRDDFDTIIEFQPSFFRSGKPEIISHRLSEWKDFLNGVITPWNYDKVMFSSACKTRNSHHVVAVNYRQGKLYLSPFLYEQIFLADDSLLIEKPTMAAVNGKVAELVGKQYAYLDKTVDCMSCEYQSTCIGRNVLTFMESQRLSACPLPLDTLRTYYMEQQ